MGTSEKSRPRFRSIRGTKDLLPPDTKRWRSLEKVLHDVMARWGYGEIRTPVFEQTELFSRSVGADSDIVSKQMYTFTDQSKTSLTLKPELTAPVMRAYIQHNLARGGALTKLYYVDSLFRQERPQAGRLRQFHQFGAEAMGSPYPEQDAEIIALAHKILEALDLKDLTLQVSSIGSKGTRSRYRQVLVDFLAAHGDKLTETSRRRLETNPLRILDTKDPDEREILKNAPPLTEYLDDEDRHHYDAVTGHLADLGIPFVETHTLVRGLDYYTRTTFEITHPHLGAQNALCGGGRYDNLVQELGGPPTPAVGFATGIERVLLALGDGPEDGDKTSARIYAVAASERARSTIFKVATQLRDRGLAVDVDTLRRSVKAQMREANRLSCTHAVIMGEEELTGSTAQVKILATGVQETVPLDRVAGYVGSRSNT
ncbi:MAG: histidine--tRNA ligase [Fidelibacterota bacterium]